MSSVNLDQLMTSLSLDDIQKLMTLLPKEEEARRTKINDLFGKVFCQGVGEHNILQLPVVQAEDLNLVKTSKYPECRVTISMLKGKSAVRGLMTMDYDEIMQRPFLALHVDILTKEGNKLQEVVELVFKRYPIETDGGKGCMHEHNYVTALTNLADDGRGFRSYLYSSGGMTPEQIQAVRDLLEGKEILTPVSDHGMRMRLHIAGS